MVLNFSHNEGKVNKAVIYQASAGKPIFYVAMIIFSGQNSKRDQIIQICTEHYLLWRLSPLMPLNILEIFISKITE